MYALFVLAMVCQAQPPTIEATAGKISMTADDVAFNLAGQNEALSLTGFLQRVARGEDAAKDASAEQGKTSATTNNLLGEARDILQRMADQQNATAAAQTNLLERINTQLEANNQQNAATPVASAAVWSGTSTAKCETQGCELDIFGRGFITDATGLYTVTAALTAGAGHILIKAGGTCPSNDDAANDLGLAETLEECTEKCAAQDGCKFFAFGAGGNAGECWAAKDCRDESGVQKAEFDFYELSEVSGQSVVGTVTSVTPLGIKVAFDKFDAPPSTEFSTTLTVEEGGVCNRKKCYRAAVPYVAGDPGAFLRWTAKGPTINFPIAQGSTYVTEEARDVVTIDFSVDDDDHTASKLVLVAASSDEAVVPTSNIGFSAVGDDGAVTLSATFAARLKSGKTTITVTVTDPLGMSLEVAFVLELFNANCDGKDTSTNWALQANGAQASMSPEDPHWGPNAGAINDGSLGWSGGPGGTHVYPGGSWTVNFNAIRVITRVRVYQLDRQYSWGNYAIDLLTSKGEWTTVQTQGNLQYSKDDSFDVPPTAATQLRFRSIGPHPQKAHRLEQMYAYGCAL